MSFYHRRQKTFGREIVGSFVLVVVKALTIDAQEAFKLHDFAGGDKMVFTAVDLNEHSGTFQLGIGHLAGDSTLPNQVIKTLFLRCAFDFAPTHVGGTDGFVRFLGTFGVRVVATTLMVVCSHQFGDDRPDRIEAKIGKVHRVGTHVGDQTRFVELLCNAHCGTYRETHLACGILLQGRGGERWSRRAL